MELDSPFENINIPENISYPKFLLDKAKTFGDRAAVIRDDTSEVWSYTTLVEQCYRLANGLYKQGLRHGDTVILNLDNCIEYLIVFFGTLLCGGTICGINAIESVDQLRYMLTITRPKFVFVADHGLAKLEDATADLNIHKVYVVGAAQERDDINHYSTLLQNEDNDFTPATVNQIRDVALMAFTSGSTGNNKAVNVSHRNLIACTLQASSSATALYNEGGDVCVMHRPFVHAYGYSCHICAGLYQGVTHVYTKEPTNIDQDGMVPLFKLINKYKVTVLLMTPARLINMMKSPVVGQYNTSSLNSIVTAGAPLSETIIHKYAEMFGITEFRNIFGMTELTIVTSDVRNIISKGAGKLLPNNKAKIVDPSSGSVVEPGTNGELWIKGPAVFMNYRCNDAANRESFVDGWFKTGDFACCDAEGYIYIADRLKELIKYDEVPVPPVAIETIILGHPAVAEVAVVGRPDDVYGELATAFVVIKANMNVTENEIQELVKGKVMKTHWLHGGVIFAESLPKLPSGKISKLKLKERFRTSFT